MKSDQVNSYFTDELPLSGFYEILGFGLQFLHRVRVVPEDLSFYLGTRRSHFNDDTLSTLDNSHKYSSFVFLL